MKTLFILVAMLPLFLAAQYLTPTEVGNIEQATGVILRTVDNYNSLNLDIKTTTYVPTHLTEEEYYRLGAKARGITIPVYKELVKADLMQLPFTPSQFPTYVQFVVDSVNFSFHTQTGQLYYLTVNKKGKSKWSKINKPINTYCSYCSTKFRLVYSESKSLIKFYDQTTGQIRGIQTGL